MSVHVLERKQKLPIAIDEAWDFFSDPRNLGLITPPDMKFEVKSALPDKMYEGLIISYNVRPIFGIRITWVAEISYIQKPEYFIDRQLSGPYKLWHHEHYFRNITGGIEMTEVVHYILPFWKIGDLVNAAIVRNRLEYIFDFRREYLEKRFGVYAH